MTNLKLFTAETRRMIKKLNLYGFSHLEIVLRNQRKGEGAPFLFTITFFKGNDARSIAFPVDDKKIALQLFDLSEKIIRKYAKNSRST